MSDLENKKSPVVITIARDFGAEGHEIGRILANELGIPLYDNELLVRASLRAGESLDKMAAYDESARLWRTWRFCPTATMPVRTRTSCSKR